MIIFYVHVMTWGVCIVANAEGFGENPPLLTSSASLPARRQLIEDTGLWTYPASPYNNTGYYAATIARQSLSPVNDRAKTSPHPDLATCAHLRLQDEVYAGNFAVV